MAVMQPITLLYDLDCGFCRWVLARVMRWDRRGLVRPVPLQDPAADELLGGMSEERKMSSWHVVSAAGTVHSGGSAVAPLVELLPGGRPLAALARRYPRAAERLYRWTADNRGPLGRRLQVFRGECHS
jgi:predicted DCC family thiol-disulfide oxidoreductase YuxK